MGKLNVPIDNLKKFIFENEVVLSTWIEKKTLK